jgi:branched-chain amino acid transport system ATP-binding protein
MSVAAPRSDTDAPVGPPALEVVEISVAYGGVNAVDHVAFDVQPGSIVGLIGPNGAGKTTVFDAICGLVSLVHGRLVLGGKEITHMAPAERARAGLGRSFQDARLFPSLTVAEALACAFERHVHAQDVVSTALGAPWVRRTERRIRRRVEELVELMGLGAFRDKFVSELSTGSRRIVDLACVLAHDPVVLLLDEPSSGIAQKETEALGPLLLHVKDSTNCTMLLIEHDMPLVTAVSDELIALEIGRVIARGSPLEVTNHPRVVEAYLGTDQRIIARSGESLGGRPPRRIAPRTVARLVARPSRRLVARPSRRVDAPPPRPGAGEQAPRPVARPSRRAAAALRLCRAAEATAAARRRPAARRDRWSRPRREERVAPPRSG